jgi:hypothetical protein
MESNYYAVTGVSVNSLIGFQHIFVNMLCPLRIYLIRIILLASWPCDQYCFDHAYAYVSSHTNDTNDAPLIPIDSHLSRSTRVICAMQLTQ